LNPEIEENQHSSVTTSNFYSQPEKPSLLSEGQIEVSPDFENDDWPENVIFEKYKTSTDPVEKKTLEDELIKLVTKHCFSIVCQQLQETRPDLVNTALASIMRNLSGFRGEAKFSTWVQKIIQNICKRDIKKKIRDRPFWQQIVEGKVPVNEDGEFYLPGISEERSVHAKILLDHIRESLSEKEQILLNMILEKRTSEEIAEVFGIAGSTARGKVQTLYKKIRARIERPRR
jgi:RNA polymerase sigma factor (sigma-70 family)